MEDFKKYLQEFPHFSESAFEIALPYLKEINIESGQYFLEQGKICKRIAFIKQGLFRTFYLNEGKEITTCFCKEKTLMCSYQSFITQRPSDLAIQALESSSIIVFSKEDFQNLYSKHLFWQHVGRTASENEFVTAVCYTRFLNDLSAKERYLQVMETDNDLLLRVPQMYLASYLQITPETLSRIRRQITTS